MLFFQKVFVEDVSQKTLIGAYLPGEIPPQLLQFVVQLQRWVLLFLFCLLHRFRPL